MEYAMAHPEEINKVAKVQTQVRFQRLSKRAAPGHASRAQHLSVWHCARAGDTATGVSGELGRVQAVAGCWLWVSWDETLTRACASGVPNDAQVTEVKEIMMQNIEKVLDRGEKLELLVDKTENLRYQADQFQKGGKALRNKMWWQNIKMKLLVALIVCIVIVIIVRPASGPPSAKTIRSHSHTFPLRSSASHASLAAATASTRQRAWATDQWR
jgi:Synaptobrevin